MSYLFVLVWFVLFEIYICSNQVFAFCFNSAINTLGFISFPYSAFTIASVVNPPDEKLVTPLCVQ